MLKLSQLLLVSPLATLLLLAVYRFLLLSLQATVRPRISARTRIQIFVSAAAHIALLFIAVIFIAVVVI